MTFEQSTGLVVEQSIRELSPEELQVVSGGQGMIAFLDGVPSAPVADGLVMSE